jgi:hypothetical protein
MGAVAPKKIKITLIKVQSRTKNTLKIPKSLEHCF